MKQSAIQDFFKSQGPKLKECKVTLSNCSINQKQQENGYSTSCSDLQPCDKKFNSYLNENQQLESDVDGDLEDIETDEDSEDLFDKNYKPDCNIRKELDDDDEDDDFEEDENFDNKNGKKLYKCDLCEYKTTLKKRLKRHASVHSTEKPFYCEICDSHRAQKMGGSLVPMRWNLK